MASEHTAEQPETGGAPPAPDAGRRSRSRWLSRSALPAVVFAVGLAVLIGLGAVADDEWKRYPIVVIQVAAYDPSELLRGAYVDLRLTGPTRPPRSPNSVRFLAAEDDARTIEGALRGQSVILQARRAPDGRLRPVAIITPDGRRFVSR
jgi:hypothetical protein